MPYQIQAFEDCIAPTLGATVVRDTETFRKMMQILESVPMFAFDTETSGLAYWAHSKAVGYAFATRVDGVLRAWYVPVRHYTGEGQLPFEFVEGPLSKLLADPSKTVVGHHLKFDIHMIRKDGWYIGGILYDTMISARMYDENRALALKSRALEDLMYADAHDMEARLNRELIRLAKDARMGITAYRDKYGYSQIPVNLAGVYACRDVQYTWELMEKYERWGVSRNYSRIWKTEMALIEVLGEMEERGMLVDPYYLNTLHDATGAKMAALEDQIRYVLGADMFKLGSDIELRNFMTEVIHLPLHRRTKGKQLSVDREVLSEFAPSDRTGVLKLILEWRDAEKIHSTYTKSILDKLDSRNVLHGSFNQAGTNTGRMSSSDPNLQNFSQDDDDRAIAHSGKPLKEGGVDPWSVRRAFIVESPRKPRLFLDYSQIELRVLAYYSKDPIMVETYLAGGDIHKRTAEEVGVNRRTAKVINFGLSYCLTPMGMARQVGISEPEAEEFMKRFFERYKGITEFRNTFWNQVRQNGGQFSNRFGRTRRVPEINSTQDWQRGRSERQAIGTLIQGTAAELTKESLVRIHRWLKAEKLPAHLVSTVHDEVWIDTDVECLAHVGRNAKRLMEDFPEFEPIPITVSGAYTVTNWADKKEAF